MICPECHAEYLDHIKECADCGVSLIDDCILDVPVPEMTWLPLPSFSGKVYADMAAELLEQNDIPYYFKMDWASSAFNIEATNLPGQTVRIFVPKPSLKIASDIVEAITGKID